MGEVVPPVFFRLAYEFALHRIVPDIDEISTYLFVSPFLRAPECAFENRGCGPGEIIQLTSIPAVCFLFEKGQVFFSPCLYGVVGMIRHLA